MAKGKYEMWLTREGLLFIEGWARDGLTDEQIAYNMGVSVASLYNWKNKYCILR
jgi:transposase